MKKHLLHALAMSAFLFAGSAAASAEQVTLTFDRTGTDAASVTVASSVDGVTATLNSVSAAMKATAGSVTSGVLCPDQNGNANAAFSFDFTVTGLPAGATVTGLGLDIHALNGASGYQDHGDNKVRQWNVTATLDDAVFGTLADIDIAAGVNTGSTERHKVWDITPAAPVAATSPMTLDLSVTSGTTNEGCFFGLSEITISYEVSEEPAPVVEGPYYRLTLANPSVPADRQGLVMGLLCDGNQSLNANGQSAANGVQAGRLWLQNKAEEGSEYADYQLWCLFENPAEAGHYALVSKSNPAGSVKGTPTEQSNNGFWEYDPEALHFDFYFPEGENYNGTTEAGVAFHVLSSYALENPSGTNKYVQGAAGGKNYRIMCWNDPLDGFGGQWYFEPEVAEEPVQPTDDVTITVNKENGGLINAKTGTEESWNATWTSTATDPGVVFYCGPSSARVNNMAWNGNNIDARSGSAKTANFTISSTSSDYYVKSYSFKASLINAGPETITAGEKSLPISAEPQEWAAENEGTGDMNFTIAGENSGVLLADFVVVLAKKAVEPAPEPTGDKYYCTFEANRKESNGKRWGTWLQDANEAVQGTYGKSTLCGTDDKTTNTVWEVTPGTAEGSVNVKNFVTGKYLVVLQANNDQVSDEPIDVWFHDFTYQGMEGIQIGVSATVNNDCIDQDNHDNLCGKWANDAGNLWFMSVLDATTPEEVEALFKEEGPVDQNVVDAFTARVDEIEKLIASYLESVPFASDDVKAMATGLAEIKANAEASLAGVTTAEGAVAKANELALVPFETALTAELNANTDQYAWSFYNVERKGYLCTEMYNDANWGYTYTEGCNAGNMWGLSAGKILALNSGFEAASNSNGYGRVGDRLGNNNKNVNFSLALKDGYVQIATVCNNGAAGELAFLSENNPDKKNPYRLENVAVGSQDSWKWQVKRYTAAEFAEAFSAQVTMWGAAVPGGVDIAKTAVEKIATATTLSEISAFGVQARADLLACIAPSTEKTFAIKSAADNKFFGYEFGFFTQEEMAANSEWILAASLVSGYSDRFSLKNNETGKWIRISSSNVLSETDTEAQANAFNIKLNNLGYVTVFGGFSPSTVGGAGDSKELVALVVDAEGNVGMGDVDTSFYSGSAILNHCWSFSYADEVSGPVKDQELIDAIQGKMDEVADLAELYKQSVPFAADQIDEVVGYLSQNTAEQLYDALTAAGGADTYQEFFSQMVVAPLEETVVESLEANAGQPWTLYEPGQGAYLSALTKATNQGWDSFNYQAGVDLYGYWNLEAKGGNYLLKSSKNQYIGTPKVHYCQATDDVDQAGEFTLGVKEGYVVFKSVAHPGNGLGFDCKNDPAEILSLEDGSKGYRWQVALYTGDLYDAIDAINAAAAEGVEIFDLQGRRVNKVSTGLYIINGVKTLVRK